MSLTESDEEVAVTELIPGPEVKYAERKRYISKHRPQIESEINKEKCSARTLGVPKVPLRLPSDYLKKQSRKEFIKIVKHIHPHRVGYQKELPSWVPVKVKIKTECGELPQDPITLSRINFTKQNVIDVKNATPTKPKERYVDTRYGTVHDLKSSGLYPLYMRRKGYGKVPKLIRDTKQKTHKEKKEGEVEEEKEKEKGIIPGEYYCITEEQRQKLLDGMKKRWSEMMKQFQCLPFMTDTPPKVQRKSKLEYALQQLEKDIATIERHPYICVYEDM